VKAWNRATETKSKRSRMKDMASNGWMTMKDREVKEEEIWAQPTTVPARGDLRPPTIQTTV
jgi:hypothetical protein